MIVAPLKEKIQKHVSQHIAEFDFSVCGDVQSVAVAVPCDGGKRGGKLHSKKFGR